MRRLPATRLPATRLPGGALAVAILAIGVLATACGGSSGQPASHSPSPTAASGSPAPAATRAAISKAYAALFGTKSSLTQSVNSLQHGQSFRSEIVAESKKPAAKGSGAKVTAVTMRSADVAKVTFTIYSKGNPALPNASGFAVRENGTWKVAAQTFCQLLTLQGNAPSACKDPKITALPH